MKQDAVTTAPSWFPLDVAGLIYPAASTSDWNCTYRLSFLLKERVEPAVLRQAVQDIYPRFPTFFVSLRRGLFWFYLKRMQETDIVQAETEYPCRSHMIFSREKPAVRVLYYKNRIAVEVFHAIADGGASLMFLKALTARYLTLKGYHIEESESIISLAEPPSQEELEDAYKASYQKEKLPTMKEGFAQQYRAKKIPNYLRVTTGRVPVQQLRAQAKSRNLTVTEYLNAVYLNALYQAVPKPHKKPFVISVPISLRSIYAKKTLRNFSLYTLVGFDPRTQENFTFEEIVELTRGQLKQGMRHESVHRLLLNSTSIAKSPWIRVVPNALKRPCMRVGFRLIGQEHFTAALSNLGKLNLPPSMQAHIEQPEMMMGNAPTKRLFCVVVSDDDYTSIVFTGDNNETLVQMAFFRLLTQHGLFVRVDSNIDDDRGAVG